MLGTNVSTQHQTPARLTQIIAAVFQFTLTCSYRPLFICFVSVTGSSVAPAYPHLQSKVQQVFSSRPLTLFPGTESLPSAEEAQVARLPWAHTTRLNSLHYF